MRHHQSWFLDLFDNCCNGKSFSGAGCAQKYLITVTFLYTLDKLIDGFGLIAGRFIGGNKFEIHKRYPISHKLDCYKSSLAAYYNNK